MARRALAALAFLIAAILYGPAAGAKPPAVGNPAPSFTLRLVDGGEVTSAGLRGQVVVLNFWATWCAPCKKELPILDIFYRMRGQYGLRVFAITTEDSLPLRKLKPVMSALSIPFVRSMRGQYPILSGLPTNYVIDRAGVVRYAKAGAFDLDALNAILIPLLMEPAPAPDPTRAT